MGKKNVGQRLRLVWNGIAGDDHVGVIHLRNQLLRLLDREASCGKTIY